MFRNFTKIIIKMSGELGVKVHLLNRSLLSNITVIRDNRVVLINWYINASIVPAVSIFHANSLTILCFSKLIHKKKNREGTNNKGYTAVSHS